MKDVRVTSAVIETLIDLYNKPLSSTNLKEIVKFEKDNSIDFNSELYFITINDDGDVFYVVGLGYSLNAGNTIHLSSHHKAFINKDQALRYILYYLKTTDVNKFKKLHMIDSCHFNLKNMTNGLESKFIYEEDTLDANDIINILDENSIIKDYYIENSFSYRVCKFIDNMFKKVLGRNS